MRKDIVTFIVICRNSLTKSYIKLFIQVTDKMMSNAKFIYPHNTPTTKEAYCYRMIFERFFPQVSI
jgi:hypothetical protein